MQSDLQLQRRLHRTIHLVRDVFVFGLAARSRVIINECDVFMVLCIAYRVAPSDARLDLHLIVLIIVLNAAEIHSYTDLLRNSLKSEKAAMHAERYRNYAVSYTHLTLPTIYSV